MAEYILSKRYLNHYGLDLKSTDLTRPLEYSPDILNAQYRKNGSIEKRKGYQAYSASNGGHGLFTYSRINPSTGLEEPECLAISNNLLKLYNTEIVVTYVGADPTASISLFYDTTTSVFRCQVTEGTTLLLDQNLGIGFDEASPVTANTLKTAIDALANFTATITGNTSTPAAFLRIVRDFDLTLSSYTLQASYWSTVNQSLTTPFAGSETNKNAENFENATAVQINNVMYLSNGYDYVMKYDGQNCYRAGLPNADQSVASAGAGTIPAGTYRYKTQFIQWDAVGNLVEGNHSTFDSITLAGAENVNVTANNTLAAAGFNHNCAIVNGAQVAVTTITVDDGSGGSHTMKTGDTAYFYDSISASYVERQITATSATTITIAGAAVTVANDAVISNNLRIGIYRTQNGGTSIYYLVAEIPNNSFASTQLYVDTKTDAQLGAEIIEPLTDRSTPPSGKYLSAFRNQLMIGGVTATPNTFYWSDVESPEYFPNSGSNQNDLQSFSSQIITGMAPNNEVFVIFQKNAIHIVSGDIANNNIRVDQLTNDVGCVAHATIQDVRGVLFFLSDTGPRQMTGGQLPEPIGVTVADEYGKSSRIDSAFDHELTDETTWYKTKRAVAINHKQAEKYLLFLPAETTESGDVYANENSAVYAYDYSRDAWLKWNNMNMIGGAVVFNDELLWTERRYSEFNSSVDHILYRQQNVNDSWDYQDHNLPISFLYQAQWESLMEPSILKRFLLLKVFSLDETTANSLSCTVRTEINFVYNVTHTQASIDLNNDGYGVSEWGTGAYGDSVEGTARIKLLGGRTKSLSVIFENETDQQNPIITGWELEIAVSNRPMVKS